MPKQPFRLRIVSDLHVGSRWGLWPPDFVCDDEPYPQSKFNRFLWQCWEHLIASYSAPDLLIVNGDLVDGDAPADRGAGVKSTESDVQQDAAVEVLRPMVAQAQKWMLVRGTGYHEKWFAGVANRLGAEKWRGGARSGQVLDLSIRGLGLNVAHHPEGGAVLYRGTSLDKTGLWSIIAAGAGKVADSQVIIRSHHHHYGLLQANGRTVIAAPAWQLQTPYAVKRSYFRFQPDIGAVDVLIAEGEQPIVVPILYPIPRKEAVKIA